MDETRILLEQHPDTILRIDQDGVIRYHNRARDAGPGIVGHSLFDFVSTDAHKLLRDMMGRVFGEGRISALELSASWNGNRPVRYAGAVPLWRLSCGSSPADWTAAMDFG